MTGAETARRTHGTRLSILFALAISIAAADHGLAKSVESLGVAGDPGWRLEGSGWRSDGVTSGEEKAKR